MLAKRIISILLPTLFLLLTAGCGNNSSSSFQSENCETDITTELTETVPVTIAQSTIEFAASETTEPESSEYTERQLVEAVYIDLYGEMIEPCIVLGENSELIEYENDADYLIKNAKTLSERCLGNISGEEDAIEKAKAVFAENLGLEYVNRIESEYIDVDGEKTKFDRNSPPYSVKYYEEYDVWYIVPNAPSGIREDGTAVTVIWDNPPYLIIRGEDGMILGFFK